VLLRAALKDLQSRGERRVEAYAFTTAGVSIEDAPMLTMPFLLRNGFTVTQPHPQFPLMRLDLKALVAWQDNLETVLESLRFPLRVPKQAPASWIEGR
jgi:uncharacterized protein Usg